MWVPGIPVSLCFLLYFLQRFKPETNVVPYWFHPDIHSLGNNGLCGLIHAFIAPLFTTMLDMTAYNGLRIREEILGHYPGDEEPEIIVDLGCGTGTSSRPLGRLWPDSRITAIDTSVEMLAIAKLSCGTPNIHYKNANAESTGMPPRVVDLVTVMFLLHEVPTPARRVILQEAIRVLKPGGCCLVLDITPEYEPSKMMLDGEPYLSEYKKNIHQELHVQGFSRVECVDIVEGHARGWWCTK